MGTGFYKNCSWTVTTKFLIVLGVVGMAMTFDLDLSEAMTPSCDKVVSIEGKELFSYLGNISFEAPKPSNGQWKLVMKTHVPYLFIGGWGVVVTDDGVNGRAEFKSTKAHHLKKGDLVTFRFRIFWAPRKPIPKVTELSWENVSICNGTGTESSWTSSFAKTNSKNNNYIKKKSLLAILQLQPN